MSRIIRPFIGISRAGKRVCFGVSCASSSKFASPGSIEEPAVGYRGMSTAGEDEVLVDRVGPCAVATLNRPKVLNALNKNMVERLAMLYSEWDKPDNGVHCIVVQGAGPKAFCAGGDVKAVVQAGQNGECHVPVEFFRSEYRMNFALAELTKPHVAILDGITMGGGCGVSMHGPFRIATEKTLFAMPECAIGLFPDVGASKFLNTLPNRLGVYLGVTGTRLKGVEVKAAGLATHFIPSESVPEIIPRLEALGSEAADLSIIDGILKQLEVQGSEGSMEEIHSKFSVMGRLFSAASLEEVVKNLEGYSGEYEDACKDALNSMKKASPLSQHLTFEELLRNRDRPLHDCLEVEFRLAEMCSLNRGDFFEGVRALLIDKDQSPKWKFDSIPQVPRSVIEEFFSHSAGPGLGLQPRAKM